jgi:hypothetical protein
MRRATASATFPVGTMRRSPSEQSLASHTSRQSRVTTRPVVDSLLQEKELLERKLAAVNSVLELEVEQFGDGDDQFVDSDEDDGGQGVLEDDDDDDAWEDHDDDDQQPGDDNNDETTAKLHSNGGSPHHHGNATSDDHHDNGSEDGHHDYQQQQSKSEVPLSLIRREREVEMEFRKLRQILQLMAADKEKIDQAHEQLRQAQKLHRQRGADPQQQQTTPSKPGGKTVRVTTTGGRSRKTTTQSSRVKRSTGTGGQGGSQGNSSGGGGSQSNNGGDGSPGNGGGGDSTGGDGGTTGKDSKEKSSPRTIPQMLEALTKAMSATATAMGTMGPASKTTDKFIARQSHAKELPIFAGKPEEWPVFIAAYERTTKTCGYTDDENLLRLQKCLKGEAGKTVQALMVSPKNLQKILDTLKLRFGQTRHIIEAMVEKARGIPAVKQDNLDSLIEFSTAATSLTTTITTLQSEHHLSNPQLVTELEKKLPATMRMLWIRWAHDKKKKENLLNFAEWIDGETELACKLTPPKIIPDKTDKPERRNRNNRVLTASDDSSRAATTTEDRSSPKKDIKCFGCDNNGHSITDCRKFGRMEVEDRWKQVSKHRLCFGCLRPGHSSSKCRSRKKCGKEGCSFTHHQLLHGRGSNNSNTATDVPEFQPAIPATNSMSNHVPESSCHSFLLNRSSRVLLRVLPVRVKGPAGEKEALALCDEGATVTLMDGSLARQLGLEGDKKPLCLQFVNHGGQFDSMEVEFSIAGVEMGSRSHRVQRAWTVDGLQLPAQAVNIEELQQQFPHLKGLPLKDVGEERPTILLGSDNFRLIAPRIIGEGRGPGPVATKCRLGWSLVGATGSTGGVTQFGIHLCTESDAALHRIVKDSFSTESFGVKVMDEQPRSKEDKRATAILASTTVRVNDNRYETGLLWKYEDFTMPSSLTTAQHRLRCMERRLDRDPEMAAQYYSKLEEYERKGYIRKLTSEEAAAVTDRTWYLPNFAVTRAAKPGKIRLVFDAAAKSSNKSLNDFLVKGPDLLQPLPEVIWKFREQPIAFTGDIREMFHQVLIRPEDQNSQRFLWRGSRRDVEPSVYVVNVMTFGAACSPCSATYVKNLNAEQ